MIRRLLVVPVFAFSLGLSHSTGSATGDGTYHVSTGGSDANPGTEARPFRSVQKAVNVARAGNTILVHAGTYHGTVRISASGTKTLPITLRAAGDGTAVLRSALPAVPCDGLEPPRERTIQVVNGADNWTIEKLSIVGGILVSGTNISRLEPHVDDRGLPGRHLYDPESAAGTLEALGSDGAEFIRIQENRISGRGILGQAAPHGEAIGNEISGIDCGTGGGVMLEWFSDGWIVRRNAIHDVSGPARSRLSDGIRLARGSMYGFVERNVIEDVGESGRGVATDLNAGWNVIRGNTVRRALHGFSEQSGGWGNRWLENVAEDNRRYGFSINEAGSARTEPDDRTPSHLEVRCNYGANNYAALYVGAVESSTFSTNSFGTVLLGDNVRSYWGSAENTWDGSSIPPAENPPRRRCRGTAHHVSTNGSDANTGRRDRPFRTVQRAVDVVVPGDTILVRGGTYSGKVRIRNSGAPDRPILLRPAGDASVTLNAFLPEISCSAIIPTRDRTVQITHGADYWTLSGLKVVGGILVSGTRSEELTPYLQDRDLTGRGMYDPAGATSTLESLGSDGADHVRILNSEITGRGVYSVAARYGDVIGNEISNIACGTGGGVMIARFSDGWTVRGNYVHHIAGSLKHWMSEGIRHTSGSMYGLVESNTVEDVDDPGRGIATDMNAGWNMIRYNTVRRTFTGLSEQESGWGNKWIGNVSVSNRKYGFNILGMDADSTRPTDRTPAYMQVRCNRASNNPVALMIGTVKTSTFSDNAFPTVELSRPLRNYWSQAGNTWDGSSRPPSNNPPQNTCS